MGTILGPKYIPYSYMEPLGLGFRALVGLSKRNREYIPGGDVA